MTNIYRVITKYFFFLSFCSDKMHNSSQFKKKKPTKNGQHKIFLQVYSDKMHNSSQFSTQKKTQQNTGIITQNCSASLF